MKVSLTQHSGNWDQTLRASSSILAGTSLIMNASGLPREKQEAIQSKIEGFIVHTLVNRIKESIPPPKQDLKQYYETMLRQVQALQISEAAKEEVIQLVSQEWKSKGSG